MECAAGSRRPPRAKELSLIPDSVIEEIRERVDVVAVIGRYVELKKSGRTWKGCCIFHGERTPSFHVYPEDKHFKCYGCGEYGDVFKFLQKLQGKEFPEVVRALAAEVGVEVPEEQESSAEQKLRRKERSEVLLACDQAARYWSARLGSRYGAEGRRYLESRGMKDEMVRLFRLGLAGSGWNDLARRLAAKKVAEAALVRAGLLVEKDRRAYDRFRGRLMFPISGLDGEVIGFGGRMLPGQGDEKGAKYINTPETVLYKKSRALYGIDVAREAIRKSRSAVLVEGYFDVIGLHQVGVKNAVAVCGTALTLEHVELLKRCDCREVTVLFDGDLAGLAAPAKAAEALLPSGLAGRVAVLPAEQGKIDPDEFARSQGKAAVEALLSAAAPLTDFLLDRATERHCGARAADASVEAKLAAVRELRPLVRLAPEGLARSTFEDRIAKKLDLDRGALAREMERDEVSSSRRGSFGPSRPAGSANSASRAEPRASRVPVLLPGPAVDALGLVVGFPELAEEASAGDLPGLFPAGPLADLARQVLREPRPLDTVLAWLAERADAKVLARLRDLSGPGRPKAVDASRELRRSLLKAKIERVKHEQDRMLALIAKAGSPVAEEWVVEQTKLRNQRRDLEKLLKSVERG
jgi:DNA primase